MSVVSRGGSRAKNQIHELSFRKTGPAALCVSFSCEGYVSLGLAEQPGGTKWGLNCVNCPCGADRRQNPRREAIEFQICIMGI